MAGEQFTARQVIDFNAGWKFQREKDRPEMKEPGFRDSGWKKLNVPHDWAIEGHLKAVKPAFDVPVMKAVQGTWRFERGDAPERKEPSFDDSGWQEVDLPASWEEHSGYADDNAWGWYRRTIEIPDRYDGKDLVLDLGCIDDMDETYFNGELIGKTGFLQPYYFSAWNTQRFYRVPARLIKFGQANLIAVKVYDGQGEGGMRSLVPVDSREGPFDMGASGGSANGFLPGGVGWYRKEFSLPESMKGRSLAVEFDGAYMDSETWINGEKLGNQPYGYTSFSYNLTPYLKYGKERNVIALRLNVLQQCTRWYSGAGIYRNVRLVSVDPLHIEKWGTYITAPELSDKIAKVKIETRIINGHETGAQFTLETIVYDRNGAECAKAVSMKEVKAGSVQDVTQETVIHNPSLWSVEDPALYSAVSRILVGDTERDRYATPFGLRTIGFTDDQGFFLNGEHVPIKGVCLHHDNGYLGTAVHKRAIERQIGIMKGMGCNAIRTSHNPPDPAFLDLCDRMGMLVMDEAFDEWKENKVTHGYGRFFDDWAEKDLSAMLLRDRNHPCIVMWSIGNEVAEQWTGTPEDAEKRAKSLADITRRIDPTRPVIAACNVVENSIAKGIAKHLDIFGINYNMSAYESQKGKYKLLGAETASAVSSRGEYNLVLKDGEVKVEDKLDNQVSSYDDWTTEWATTAWKTLKTLEEAPWVAGEFVWTGFDYIGEPTPYWWPAVISFFGIVDLCGFPKDRYYLYKSRWTKEPMVHVLPHWNWPQFRGKEIPVYVYTNCGSVELFLNGRSLGEKRIKDSEKLRLEWNVAYEEGELKAVAKNNGMMACEDIVRTVGKPATLELSADRAELDADGRDLSYITVRALDKDGHFCPTAGNLIQFKLKGAGELAATGNGNSVNHAFFNAKECKLFNGMCIAIVRSSSKAGKIKLSASSAGLKGASVDMITKIQET